MPKDYLDVETARGFCRLRKNAAVLVLTDEPGVTWNGVVRSPSPKKSLVRYNERGVLREERIPNAMLVPVHAKPKADSAEGD